MQDMTTIKIDAGRTLFSLSNLMIGANMEDLHYQMTGGLSSQLIHGESFFEPTPTEVAVRSQPFAGFTARGGDWRPAGEAVTVRVAGPPTDAAAVPAAAGVVQEGAGARLSTDSASAPERAQLSAEIRFPAGAAGGAGLALRIQPNEADERWEWFSGYTVELRPQEQTVTLKKAARANKHTALTSAACAIPKDTWVSVAVKIAGRHVRVWVDGREVLACEDDTPLPPGRVGVWAQENVSFRRLVETDAEGRPHPAAFTPHPLRAAPGDALSLRWRRAQSGTARGSFTHDAAGSWRAGKPSQGIVFESGEGEWGIDNAGLCRWGLRWEKGRPYEGFLRVRGDAGTELCVSLRSADGQTVHALETLRLSASDGEYERIAFELTPADDDPDGRFAITLRQPGAVTVGYVFLQPGAWGRFHNLPIRRDIAEAVIGQGIRALRLNGGMIEVPDYRWENMQGPRDERPPFNGFYDRWCGHGFGLIEFLQFCEAAGLVPIPALDVDETPESVADFVAYATAHENTPAGRRRAEDGHPPPFPMPFYQLANECPFDRKYVDQFRKVAEAVWEVAPEITLITTVARPDVQETDGEAAVREKLALPLELLRFAQERGKKLVFDCHSFSGTAVPGIALFGQWVKRLAARPEDVSTAILEFNAGAFDLARGLAHARELGLAYRAGDVIRAIGTPNLSQPWGVYQTDWKAVLWTQGSIYYTQHQVWFQPAYYVDQMIARSWVAGVVAATVQQGAEGPLDVFAGRSNDGRLLALRVVNPSPAPVAAQIRLTGFTPTEPDAQIEQLAGSPDDFNTREQPEKIKPVRHAWPHQIHDGRTHYTFPAHSFTVIKFSGRLTAS